MKARYDFSKMKARRNPYASKLKRSVTMRLSEDVVAHSKAMAKDAGVPYQSLIDLYLRDCLAQNRRIQVRWPSAEWTREHGAAVAATAPFGARSVLRDIGIRSGNRDKDFVPTGAGWSYQAASSPQGSTEASER